MSLNENSKLDNYYDLLVQKQFEIGKDPELKSLYEKANRHFFAALDYHRQDCLEVNTDYELEQVENALEAFDEVKEQDKGT